MKAMWGRMLALTGLLVTGPAAAAGEGADAADVALPVVPVAAVQDTAGKAPAGTGTAFDQAPRELRMVPGVNEIIPVSRGHTNRLVTPFHRPDVHTTSDAVIDVDRNVIYVATDREIPVTMYITPHEDESVALSLTLVPRRIPPVQVELKMDRAYGSMVHSEQARRWEKSRPYIDTLREALRRVALGEIPQGYTLREAGTKDILPNCTQASLRYDFEHGQVLEGYNLSVFVGTARNVGRRRVEVRETQCATGNTAAVAVWPHYTLSPGEATEIYVVRRRVQRRSRQMRRPSLVRTGSR